MNKNYLVITSIAGDQHPVLKQYARESKEHGFSFLVIGDTKSPTSFQLEGCDYYSIAQQDVLDVSLAKILPKKHYARKNLGYLIAALNGAEVIVETDDDNLPLASFWSQRSREVMGHHLANTGWTNAYRYFTAQNIWPRGFALEEILNDPPNLSDPVAVSSPIHQGLADDNPDVDAIYRLTAGTPITFSQHASVMLGQGAICPFNSQNTTWFKEAFPLLYLPSYCSFRMTDIWRSFVAQRIAWTCGWSVVFHQSTVRQDRNEHNLMSDFSDEILGYTHNHRIMQWLMELDLRPGLAQIADNMTRCYDELIKRKLIDPRENELLKAWLTDIRTA